MCQPNLFFEKMESMTVICIFYTYIFIYHIYYILYIILYIFIIYYIERALLRKLSENLPNYCRSLESIDNRDSPNKQLSSLFPIWWYSILWKYKGILISKHSHTLKHTKHLQRNYFVGLNLYFKHSKFSMD